MLPDAEQAIRDAKISARHLKVVSKRIEHISEGWTELIDNTFNTASGALNSVKVISESAHNFIKGTNGHGRKTGSHSSHVVTRKPRRK